MKFSIRGIRGVTGSMNELFILLFDSLDQSGIREGELQSLQLMWKKNKDLINQLEKLERTQEVEISQLKEKVSKLEDELKSRDKKIKALTLERANLIGQVQTQEAVALSARELLKEAKFMRDIEVASMVAKVAIKFKESKELTALLKKDYHNGYDVGVMEIFYNIWAKNQDLDYSFLGGELTNLICERLKEEKLNAPNPMPSSLP